jgi:hypothetical protein
MFTRSTSTPGTVRSSAQGSRDVGIFSSSICVKLVAVPIAFVSTIGDSPLTVIISCTVATFSGISTSTFDPTVSERPWRMTRAKPGKSTVTV